MEFRLVGEPTEVEVIARGHGIRELKLLRRRFGGRAWRKVKGWGQVELPSGRVRRAELHWYECHGIGRTMLKIKRLLD